MLLAVLRGAAVDLRRPQYVAVLPELRDRVSYVLYLVHRLSKGAIDQLIAPGGSIPDQLLRFVLITVVGLLGAEVLRQLVEQPMIRLGPRLTSWTGLGVRPQNWSPRWTSPSTR